MSSLVARDGGYFLHWLDKVTEAMARLHGEVLAREAVPDFAHQESLRKEEAWPDGASPPAVSPTIPRSTS